MTRALTRLLAVALTLAFAPASLAHADEPESTITTVRLRNGVRIEPGNRVTLGDIARVAGPQAELLTPIVLADALTQGSDPIAIRVDAVREAIDEIDGVMHGRLTVTGAACTVMVRRAPRSQSEPRPARPNEHAAGRISLRVRVLEHLRALFNASPDAIRAAFDPRDDELLDTDTAGLTVELRTLGGSSRIPLAITIYNGDRVVKSESIRVVVQLRRDVAISNQSMGRGAEIAPEHITVENRWTDASMTPVAPAEVLGRVVRTRLKPGAVITANDITRPVHVERGDITSIRSVVGTAVVRTKARARADGTEGDVIEFEALDGSVRFLARVVGPGRAVVAPETGLAMEDER
ncbi:MAG: hypothetical protein DHS20C14_01110 [Phycisphaeraceae bacterium]|nr:MAG: hypothetical protein DHS20C14_01110 [Phycisphaeraceae bacterium]